MTTENNNDRVYRIGQFFTCDYLDYSTERNILQLVQVSKNTFNLIDIISGNRWEDKPFMVESKEKDWHINIPAEKVEALVSIGYRLKAITNEEAFRRLLQMKEREN